MFSLQQCLSFIQSGKASQAIVVLNGHLSVNSKDIESHHLIGVAYFMEGEHRLAEKHFQKTLKLNSKHLDAQYNLARLYIDLKKNSKAKGLLLAVLAVKPDWLQARFSLGLAAIALKDSTLALKSFQQVVNTQPDNFEAWLNIGNIKFEQEDFDGAIHDYKKALKIKPDSIDIIVCLANVYRSLNQFEKLIVYLEESLKVVPHIKIYLRLAEAYKLTGDKLKAKECASIAIEMSPINGEGYKEYYDAISVKSLSDLGPLKDALNQDGLEDESRMLMCFAMSKGLESCGEYEQAIGYLDTANALRRKELSYSTKESSSFFNILKKIYSESALNELSNDSHLGSNVIFILGMPRSGTSLVEQILSSHNDVFGAGELSTLRTSWRKAGVQSEAKFHTQLVKKGSDYWGSIGQQYLDEVNKLKQDERWVSDKMPHNFLMMGLIVKVLPNAKIVHCKRNPIANCLSIYKANFSGVHNYAYNQEELAEYHNLYEGLMSHWRTVMPNRFYEIKYEDLISNQEEETRKLLDYCELPWEDACLDFHKNKRAVTTASAYQVRQPINNKSVDLWKRYGDGLKPLLDNLHIPTEYQD